MIVLLQCWQKPNSRKMMHKYEIKLGIYAEFMVILITAILRC